VDFEGEGGKKCFSDFFPSEFSVFPEKLFWEKFSYLFFDQSEFAYRVREDVTNGFPLSVFPLLLE